MLVKFAGSEVEEYLIKGKRFIRMASLRKEIADLRAQGRLLYSGNMRLGEIALTFDDGPDPNYTPQILDVLQRYGIKATFFCIGRQVKEYPRIVRQEHEAGHVIGNHSWTHSDLGLLPASDLPSELNLTFSAIQEVTGVQSAFFRPPFGSLSTQLLTQASCLGVTTVMWNAGEEARDYASPGVAFIVHRILNLVRNGTIILMHDGGGDRSQTVEALPTIIQRLQDRGFQFVTIQQMVDGLHENLYL
jgi:peptidoglycan-N-acetylglucosamine deacetylase